MKLTTNKALQAMVAADRARELLRELAMAEKLAPLNVHSHGAMIEEAIEFLNSASFLALQFQREVQGR